MATKYPQLNQPEHVGDCVGTWIVGTEDIRCSEECGGWAVATRESATAATLNNYLGQILQGAAGNGAMLLRGEIRPSAVGFRRFRP